MHKMLALFLATLAMVMAPALTARAQKGPLGFAAVQAPEAGSGICFDSDAGAAISCAEQLCMDESDLGLEDCRLNGFCFPAGWSADLFQQHQEGLHWHAYLCGWQSKDQLEAAATVACDLDWLVECSIVRIWSPQGREIEVGMDN